MVLSFTAIDRCVQFRSFCCQLDTLEVALDVLNRVAAQGDTLITAHIIDGDSRTELSPEAFNGESFVEPIQQLEKQWQAILSEPVRSIIPTTNWRIDFTRHQIKMLDERITHLALLIYRIEEFCKRAESTRDEQQKNKLMWYYDTLINTYQQQVKRAKASQKIAQKKLAQLQE